MKTLLSYNPNDKEFVPMACKDSQEHSTLAPTAVTQTLRDRNYDTVTIRIIAVCFPKQPAGYPYPGRLHSTSQRARVQIFPPAILN